MIGLFVIRTESRTDWLQEDEFEEEMTALGRNAQELNKEADDAEEKGTNPHGCDPHGTAWGWDGVGRDGVR